MHDAVDAAHHEALPENPDYLTRQLITYLGNKRALLGFIGQGAEVVRRRLGRQRLTTFDVFAGSGVVSRFLRRMSEHQIANDLEPYAAVINRCYLASPSQETRRAMHAARQTILDRIAADGLRVGLIAELYAPQHLEAIQPGERCFYTPRNARYLDTVRQLIDEADPQLRDFLLAPLLAEASVHANTSGVFKGFYKDSASGLGQFGGNKRDALVRILSDVALPAPVFSRYDVPCEVYQRDANALVRELPEVDLAYIDPPYNQHPYGSNYFMLNLLVDYRRPQAASAISGIPGDWQRSTYNRRRLAQAALTQLVADIRAKYLLISFNSEGFVSRAEMTALLQRVGKVDVIETDYNAFRGSRNLEKRETYVKEFLYLVEKA